MNRRSVATLLSLGTRYVRAYQVSGRFAGEQVSLHLQSELCPVRGGTAVRQGPPY